jgi:hypothetical protein
MEFLQFFSYLSVDECALSSNSFLTLLSYIHIAFQPIFVNMFLMEGLQKKPSPKVRAFVYAACLAVAALILIKLVPFVPSSLCALGQTICGPQLCTLSGAWHLAWSVPQYNLPIPGDSFIYYALAAMIVPLFYGARQGVVLLVLSGPVLAYFLAGGNAQEWPSIWCFYSVLLIMLTLGLHIYRRRHDLHPLFSKWRK